MSETLITLGCFLWFALLFNGGIGPDWVNYSAFTSGMMMIVTGFAIGRKMDEVFIRITSGIAISCYGAVIWNRLRLGADGWFAWLFDAAFVLMLLAAMLQTFFDRKPDERT